jgi:hypothetical protein
MRFSLNRFVFASIVVLLFLGGNSASGQGTSATLTGQVTDNSGAVVPGATVTATNTDTSLTQMATTNGDGVYLIAPLPPGHYKLAVEAKGFERYLQTGIELSVNVNSTQNVVLKTGSVQETVTVFENAELINTTSPELGTTVNEAAVTQLPLNGRDPSSLVFLAPGTTSVLAGGGQPGIQAGFSFPTETGASANGGRQGSTEYLLDGVPNMDNYLGLTAPFPNADATQEFRVITNNFNTLYGFAPGAVVSVETRSGSNSFHGGAFEFLRNKDLNASNYFTGSTDPLRRNQFGGYVGGPIKRDKIFFFLNYQGTRAYSAATSNFTQTPTAAMLAGDFSAVGTTLCNPASKNTPLGCPFATVGGKPNQVNPALFNPAAVTVTTTGLPLGGDAQNTPGGVFYPGAAVIQNFDEGTARLDFNISPSQRISLRSFVDNLIQPSEDIPGNILSVLNPSPWSEVFGERMEFYNEALSHTWTVNPTTVNTVSVFWTQMSAHNAAAVKDINGQNMCWSRYINVNELPGQCYMEGFSVSGGEGFNGGWTEPSQEVRTTYGVYDNFSKTIGKHVLSFGMNLQHQYAAENTQYPTTPIIGFNGQYTGNGLADWLLGYMQSYEQGAGEIAVVRGWQPGFYGQDQFRIRPNLTITAGLRWDPNIAPGVAGGRGAAFVPGQQSTLFPNSPLGLVFPGDKGISDGLMPNTYRAYWEPRVGLAWQPSFLPNTSVRAAFGMFTAPLQYSMYNHTADISPFSPTYTLQGGLNTPLSLSDPWSQNAGTNFVSPFPPFAPFKPPSNAPFATPFTIPAVFDQDFKLGVTQSWNLSIEHQFGANLIVRGAYVGSESYHQSDIIDQNPGICGPIVAGACSNGGRTTFTNFLNILDNFSNGTASYNALQLSVERHLNHGLQFQSNFTWSKTIDTASSGNISFGTNQLPNPFDLGYNRGISAENVPFIWVTNLIYTTPALRDKNPFIRETLGSWEVGGIVTLQSGFPFGISGGDGNNNSGSLQFEDRADIVPGQAFDVRPGGKSQWLNQYFNTAAFTNNAVGTFGDSGKNMFQGPPIKTMDAVIAKNWYLHERYSLQFRWEMFNAFNTPSFSNPDNTVGDGNFGKITSIGAVPPRVMQAGLKFAF